VSLHPDIDDFTTDQLRKEIRKRERLIGDGKCPYCGGDMTKHTCKYAGRVEQFHTEANNAS
jgi:hypothetical protein